MKKIFSMRSLKWLTLGCLSTAVLAIVGCQGNQTKIDLPAPTGAPAYLLSVDEKSNVNIFSPKGEPWQECNNKCASKLDSKYRVDTKALLEVYKKSKAAGGFTILNFQEMKQAGIFNVTLIESAHAGQGCAPLFKFEFSVDYSYFLPPGCPLP